MKIFDPKFTGSIEFLNTITGNLTVDGTINATIEGTTATASYVSIDDVDGFSTVSQSIASRLYNQEAFSASLDATFATDAQVATAVSSLNAATSSYLLNTTDTLTGDLTVTGRITAQEFHTEFVSASIVYESGSTKFGNSLDDVQSMTGSLQVSGSSHYLLGNVGIGTTTPSEKLEVAGNAKVTGSLSVQNIQYASGDILTVSENGTITKINRDNAAELLGVNSKTLMQDLSFGESYINNYRSRVLDNTGTYFPTPAGYNFGVLKNKGYLEKAGVVLLPSGVKTGGLFSVKPKNGNGDFDFTRNSIATYVDEDGLIQIAEANVPRLDYPILNGVVQSCPALLLEPSRTNIVPYSEAFDNAAWSKFALGIGSTPVVTANQGLSPDGTMTADRIVLDLNGGVSSDDSSFLSEVVTVSSGATVSLTIYLKSNTGLTQNLIMWEAFTGEAISCVVTNEWQRFNVIATAPSTSSGFRFGLRNAFGVTVDDTADILAWGAQAEEGSYATSYIPTSGSSVTRAADAASGSGNTQVFNDSEGVLFAEISALANDGANRNITISDGSTSNRMFIYLSTVSNQFVVRVDSGGSTQTNFSYTLNDITQYNKISFKYETNNVSIWANGFKLYTDPAATMPTGLNKLSFDNGTGSSDFYGNTKQVLTFKEALTDAELEDLTSWDSFEELAASQFYTLY